MELLHLGIKHFLLPNVLIERTKDGSFTNYEKKQLLEALLVLAHWEYNGFNAAMIRHLVNLV